MNVMSTKMKRVFCFLAACAMAASIAGCAKKEETSNPAESSKPSTAAPSKTEEEKESIISSALEEDVVADAMGYTSTLVPLPDESIMKYPVEGNPTVSMYVGFPSISAKYYQSWAEDITCKQIMEDTGINIDFVHYASGQSKENFNLLVVSDSLPDIIVYGSDYYAGGDSAAVADGVFLDLTPYMYDYAPDYMYLMDNNDMFWRTSTTNDGSIYSIYAYKDIQAPWYDRAQFRADWLEEFGMDIPKTFADYEEYFKKVLETKPGVAPYTPETNGIEQHFLGSFDCGTVSNGGRFFVKEGQVHHTFLEPGFKDYLTMMADWYAKGYISKDFTTTENIDNDFCNGLTGFVVGNTDGIYTLAHELGVETCTAPYPRVNEGDEYHGNCVYYPNNGIPTNISAKSKNVEAALQLLNYGYTKQGAGVHCCGDPDTTWYWSEEVNPEYGTTTPVYTDYALNCPDYPMSDIEYTVRLHVSWCKYRYGDDIMMIRNAANKECWDYRAKWGDDPTADGDYALPSLTYDTDAASERGALLTNVNTYGEEMVLKYITGAADLANYETEFVDVIKGYGIERVIELTQDAYEDLLARQR